MRCKVQKRWRRRWRWLRLDNEEPLHVTICDNRRSTTVPRRHAVPISISARLSRLDGEQRDARACTRGDSPVSSHRDHNDCGGGGGSSSVIATRQLTRQPRSVDSPDAQNRRAPRHPRTSLTRIKQRAPSLPARHATWRTQKQKEARERRAQQRQKEHDPSSSIAALASPHESRFARAQKPDSLICNIWRRWRRPSRRARICTAVRTQKIAERASGDNEDDDEDARARPPLTCAHRTVAPTEQRAYEKNFGGKRAARCRCCRRCRRTLRTAAPSPRRRRCSVVVVAPSLATHQPTNVH